MKYFRAAAIGALMLALGPWFAWGEGERYVPGELIVKFRESVSAQAYAYSQGKSKQVPSVQIASLQRRYGIKRTKRLHRDLDDPKLQITNRTSYLSFEKRRFRQANVRAAGGKAPETLLPNLHNIYVLQFGNPTLDMEQAAKECRSDPNVEYAHPNYFMTMCAVPNDADYVPQQQALYQRLSAETGWDLSTGNSTTVIAIVDSGVEWTHPDLAGNIWGNAAESGANSDNGVDDDGNGKIDDVRGWDFVDYASNTHSIYAGEDGVEVDNDPMDRHGHGTMMAGLAAAVSDNSAGIAGVAWHCAILPVRVAFKVSYSPYHAYALTSWMAEGINYAANNGASVINISFYDNNWGSPTWSIKDAVDAAYAKGAVIVASAGNYGDPGDFYPAAYPKVIGVTATDALDQCWTYSNFGACGTVAAPGVDMYTTTLGGGYARGTGTSMSTAIVSGLAGLVRSRHPEFTPAQVKLVLESTADPIVSDKYLGTGRVNVRRALEMTAVPEAAITTPVAEVILSTAVTIRGTAGGANFASYSLEHGARLYPVSWSSAGISIPNPAAAVTDGVLGTWDVSAVQDNLPYTLRLRVTDTSGNVSISERVVYVQRSSQPGWPKTGLGFFGNGGLDNGIAVGDLDHDGGVEIVVNMQTNITSTGIQNLYVYRPDGSPMLGWPRTNLNIQMRQPAVANLLGRNESHVVISGVTWGVAYSSMGFHVLNHQGNYLPGWPVTVNSNVHEVVFNSPSVGDVNGDGINEIVFTSERDQKPTFAGAQAVVYVFQPNAAPLPGWPKFIDLGNVVGDYGIGAMSRPCLVDLDHDGDKEIVASAVAKNETRVYVWDGAGNTLTGWPKLLAQGLLVHPVAGDIDHDGDMEIVATESGDGELVHAWEADGTNCPGWPIDPNPHSSLPCLSPILADLNGDSYLEIIFYNIGIPLGTVCVYNHQGVLQTGWPQTIAETTQGGYNPCPIAADVDGDGLPEVIYTAGEDNKIYAWNFDGTLVPGWPLSVPGQASLSPAYGDFNQDGHAELVYDYNGSTLNIQDLGVVFNPKTSAWPSIQFNANQTGTYITDYTGPTVRVDWPQSGMVLKDLITLEASAEDDIAVRGVRFFIDGTAVGAADTTAPYQASWNTWSVANGAHEVTALAWDEAGNQTTSAPEFITVDNPDVTRPTVSIAEPANNTTVARLCTVRADVSDDRGVVRVQFYLDAAALMGADTSAPFAVSWDTTTAADGVHRLQATAWDAAGNSGFSAGVSVTVVNAISQHQLEMPVGSIKVIGAAASRGAINPQLGGARIDFHGSAAGTYECRVFDLAGDQVWAETKFATANGDHFTWPAQVASGTYVIWVNGPGIRTSKKTVVLR